MPDTVHAILLRDSAALEAFVPQWTELWANDSKATPFGSPEWLLPWWHQFGQAELRAAVVFAGERVVAFLPFYVYPEPATGERKLLLLGAGTTDYLDGLFAPSCRLADVRCGLRAIQAAGGWDSLVALQMKPDSLLHRALRDMDGGHGFLSESCSRMRASPVAELPQKIRRNVMYYRNRAQRLGEVRFRVADARDCLQAFETLRVLHTERWTLRGEAGVLADPRVLAWHREAIPRLQARGTLRLCSLSLGGEVVGVLYSLVDLGAAPGHSARTQYFYLTAFSPRHAELRPGTLLLAYAIEQAAGEGVEIIDMLRGDEAYKEIWHMQRVATHGMTLPAAGDEDNVERPRPTAGEGDPHAE